MLKSRSSSGVFRGILETGKQESCKSDNAVKVIKCLNGLHGRPRGQRRQPMRERMRLPMGSWNALDRWRG